MILSFNLKNVLQGHSHYLIYNFELCYWFWEKVWGVKIGGGSKEDFCFLLYNTCTFFKMLYNELTTLF